MNRRNLLRGVAATALVSLLPRLSLATEDPRITVFTALKEAVENSYDIYTHSRIWLVLALLKQGGVINDSVVSRDRGIGIFVAWVKYNSVPPDDSQIIQYSFVSDHEFIVVPNPERHPWQNESNDIVTPEKTSG
jgi:hypothetical protein